MADEQKESRIKVEDLPQPERELTAREQEQIQGGVCPGQNPPPPPPPTGGGGGLFPEKKNNN